MIWQHVLSLSVLSGYFLTILGLFSLILYTLYARGISSNLFKVSIFVVLALGSLAHTWFYMFSYMEWSFRNYEKTFETVGSEDLIYRIASWLYDTSLFEEAWSYVVFHPLHWWWSEQLCLFTVGAWTVLIAIEGTRYKVKHLWAYMLLGQIVAISVASNLFYLALALSPTPSSKKSVQLKAGPRLWLSVLLSLTSVAVTPFTSRQTFLPNLLFMHALLFVPLVPTSSSKARFSISTRALYRVVHIAAVLIHLRTVLNAALLLNNLQSDAPTNPVTAAWIILHSHPAQSSISWDVVWTSASFIIWKLLGAKQGNGKLNIFSALYLLLATPAASIGVTAPYALLPTNESTSTFLKKE